MRIRVVKNVGYMMYSVWFVWNLYIGSEPIYDFDK